MIRNVTVGTELPSLRPPAISRKTLALFAGASGDHQPSHIDIDAARAKGREDVIAHGMLIMAYMGRMLTDFVPQERIRSFASRFVAITPVHAELICAGRVVAVADGIAHLEMETRLADGKIVARGEAVIDLRP